MLVDVLHCKLDAITMTIQAKNAFLENFFANTLYLQLKGVSILLIFDVFVEKKPFVAYTNSMGAGQKS